MKKTLVLAALAVSVAACAGRAPQPVQLVQPQDPTMDCSAINAQLAADAAKQTELGKEKGTKVAQNVVAGVTGAVLFFPALFLMDFQDAAGTDSKALEARDQYLTTLALQRCQVQASR
jgi:hypothetical protein